MTINLWGRETQNPLVINADTGVQRTPVVASVGLDAFAVAWVDGTNKVSLKFFDEQGNVDAASPQVTVSDATSANISSLQMTPGGAGIGYGIAWSEDNAGVSQLKLRYYNHVTSSTLGGEISISSNVAVAQHDLEISGYNKDDARGRAIVDGFDAVWVEGAGGDHASGAIYLQRFAVPLDARKDPTSPPTAAGLDGVVGASSDAQVQIATGRDPSVAGINVGLGGADETIVTFIDLSNNINILAFNNAGTPLNTITGVVNNNINTAARPVAAGTQQHVTALQGGGFLVAWISANGANHDLVGRVFTPGAAGGAWTAGPIFVIDPLNGGSNAITDFAVAAQETDGFSVSWTAIDGASSAIFSRVYTGGGIANDDGVPAIFHAPANTSNVGSTALFGDRYVVVYEDNAVDAGDISARILDPRFDTNGLPITVDGPGITMIGDPDFEARGRIAGDILVGTDGRDTINGRQGDDIMDGGLGNDTILAGVGNDTIDGGGGSDTLVLTGRFSIDGNAANDDYTLSYLGGGLFQITDKRAGAVNEGIDFVRSIENFQFLGNAPGQQNFTLTDILGIETTSITPTAWGWTNEDADNAPNADGTPDVDGFIVNPGVTAGIQKNVSVSDSVGEFVAVAWEEAATNGGVTHIKGRFYDVVLAPDEFMPNTMNLSDGIGIETNVAIASGGANSGWGFVFEQRDNATDTTRELRTNFMGPGQLVSAELSVAQETNVDQHDAAIFGSQLDRTLLSPVGGSVLPTGMNEGYNVAWVSTHTDGVDGTLDAGYGRIMMQRFELVLDPLGNPGAPEAAGIDGIAHEGSDAALWVGNEDAISSDGFFGRNPSTSALHTFETGIVWVAKDGAGEKVMFRAYDDLGQVIDYPAGNNISVGFPVAAGTSAHIVSAGAVNFAIVWITPDATSPSGYTVMATMLSSAGGGLDGVGFGFGQPSEPFVVTHLPAGFDPAHSDFAATGLSGEDSNDIVVSWTVTIPGQGTNMEAQHIATVLDPVTGIALNMHTEGDIVTVNATTAGNQHAGGIAGLLGDRFVAVFEDDNPSYTDGTDLVARVMDTRDAVNPDPIVGDLIQAGGRVQARRDVLVGTNGNDNIRGDILDNNGLVDWIFAGMGDDIVQGGPGIKGAAGIPEIIDGGEGIDTAVYTGRLQDYSITPNGDGSFEVIDLRPVQGANNVQLNHDGIDNLYNFEKIQFLDLSNGGASAQTITFGFPGQPPALNPNYDGTPVAWSLDDTSLFKEITVDTDPTPANIANRPAGIVVTNLQDGAGLVWTKNGNQVWAISYDTTGKPDPVLLGANTQLTSGAFVNNVVRDIDVAMTAGLGMTAVWESGSAPNAAAVAAATATRNARLTTFNNAVAASNAADAAAANALDLANQTDATALAAAATAAQTAATTAAANAAAAQASADATDATALAASAAAAVAADAVAAAAAATAATASATAAAAASDAAAAAQAEANSQTVLNSAQTALNTLLAGNPTPSQINAATATRDAALANLSAATATSDQADAAATAAQAASAAAAADATATQILADATDAIQAAADAASAAADDAAAATAQSAADTAALAATAAQAAAAAATQAEAAAQTAKDSAQATLDALLANTVPQSAIDAATATRDLAQSDLTTAIAASDLADVAATAAQALAGQTDAIQAAADAASAAADDAAAATAQSAADTAALAATAAQAAAAAATQAEAAAQTAKDSAQATLDALLANTVPQSAIDAATATRDLAQSDLTTAIAASDLADVAATAAQALAGQTDAIQAAADAASAAADDAAAATAQSAADTAALAATAAQAAAAAATQAEAAAQTAKDSAQATLDALLANTVPQSAIDAATATRDLAQSDLTTAIAASDLADVAATAAQALAGQTDAIQAAADAASAAADDAAAATAQSAADTAALAATAAQSVADGAALDLTNAQSALTVAQDALAQLLNEGALQGDIDAAQLVVDAAQSDVDAATAISAQANDTLAIAQGTSTAAAAEAVTAQNLADQTDATQLAADADTAAADDAAALAAQATADAAAEVEANAQAALAVAQNDLDALLSGNPTQAEIDAAIAARDAAQADLTAATSASDAADAAAAVAQSASTAAAAEAVTAQNLADQTDATQLAADADTAAADDAAALAAQATADAAAEVEANAQAALAVAQNDLDALLSGNPTQAEIDAAIAARDAAQADLTAATSASDAADAAAAVAQSASTAAAAEAVTAQNLADQTDATQLAADADTAAADDAAALAAQATADAAAEVEANAQAALAVAQNDLDALLSGNPTQAEIDAAIAARDAAQADLTAATSASDAADAAAAVAQSASTAAAAEAVTAQNLADQTDATQLAADADTAAADDAAAASAAAAAAAAALAASNAQAVAATAAQSEANALAALGSAQAELDALNAAVVPQPQIDAATAALAAAQGTFDSAALASDQADAIAASAQSASTAAAAAAAAAQTTADATDAGALSAAAAAASAADAAAAAAQATAASTAATAASAQAAAVAAAADDAAAVTAANAAAAAAAAEATALANYNAAQSALNFAELGDPSIHLAFASTNTHVVLNTTGGVPGPGLPGGEIVVVGSDGAGFALDPVIQGYEIVDVNNDTLEVGFQVGFELLDDGVLDTSIGDNYGALLVARYEIPVYDILVDATGAPILDANGQGQLARDAFGNLIPSTTATFGVGSETGPISIGLDGQRGTADDGVAIALTDQGLFATNNIPVGANVLQGREMTMGSLHDGQLVVSYIGADEQVHLKIYLPTVERSRRSRNPRRRCGRGRPGHHDLLGIHCSVPDHAWRGCSGPDGDDGGASQRIVRRVLGRHKRLGRHRCEGYRLLRRRLQLEPVGSADLRHGPPGSGGVPDRCDRRHAGRSRRRLLRVMGSFGDLGHPGSTLRYGRRESRCADRGR